MNVHINQIRFDGNDRWTNQFNKCSDYFQKSNDMNLSESERNKKLSVMV